MMDCKPVWMRDRALILVPARRSPGAATACAETRDYLGFYFLCLNSSMSLLARLGAHDNATGREWPSASGTVAILTALVIRSRQVAPTLGAPFPKSRHMMG